MTTGLQSALEPAGVHAEKIGRLWDIFLAVSVVVYVLVLVFLLVALFRRRRESQSTERGAFTAVSVATGITVLTLFALLISSIFTGRGIASVTGDTVRIELTGRQWWWQADYDHPDRSKRFTTANELTIPVGMPVFIKLRSPDVIHSFWVPNLHGKQDLIPGHDGGIILKATRPGLYRGQCAEFCGLQHAKMALWVNAVAPADYARWVESQRQSSKIPSTPQQRQGQEVFMSSPCPLCHNIQGTNASGKTGPDLTHFGSRRSVAAAALPNRRDTLAKWIVDPQHIKPGAYMPAMPLHPRDLDALLTYMESLQ
ncbi:MAG: cytochrome c oxidase subunit II [Thermoanaerobaculia bacterium]